MNPLKLNKLMENLNFMTKVRNFRFRNICQPELDKINLSLTLSDVTVTEHQHQFPPNQNLSLEKIILRRMKD